MSEVKEPSQAEASKCKELDIFRDTPVRFLGYSNEVGEACRPIVPKPIVWLSYAFASTYVLADVTHKSYKAYTSHSGDTAEKSLKSTVAREALDALIWQSLASIIIPSVVINRTCFTSLYLMSKVKTVPQPIKNVTATIIGLSIIPFIVKPIDSLVDYAMGKSS